MGKKILVLYYSQSGQLGSILSNYVKPLIADGNLVETVNVCTKKEYIFPWTSKSFFDVMPDCVLGVPTELEQFQCKESKYDLIILGYQAWFLSPSIPINSILQNNTVKNILHNTPVITITGARNMWITALERIKPMLQNAGAKHVANIVTQDRHSNFISFFTIQHWMYSGKKDKMFGFLPLPGVSDKDIKDCSEFGQITIKYLATNNYNGLQAELLKMKAVVVKYNLMFIESKASKLFGIWAKVISTRKNKATWLVAFKYYLIIAFLIAAPIILTVNTLFFRPFLGKRIKKQINYYSGVNQLN
ncbi:MAG: hypothetical protein ABL929_01175 [Ferruginibacter sp.]|nr:hypothetical protein [Ferruginibacter sp.]